MSRVRYALPLLVLAQGLGILFVDRIAVSAQTILWFSAGLVLAYFLFPRMSVGRSGVALALGCLAGAFSFANRVVPESLGGVTFPEDRVVEAMVCEGPHVTSASLSMVLCSLEFLPGPGHRPLLRGGHRREGGGAELRAYVGDPEYEALSRLQRGDRFRAWLRLRPMESSRNPGGRDEKAEGRRKGLGFTARVISPELLVRVLESGSGPEWPEDREARGVAGLRTRASTRLIPGGATCGESGDEIRACGGALLAALALGDRHGIPFSVKDAFARLGLSHLLAVSGLHLMLIAGMAYRFVFVLSTLLVAGRVYHDRRPLALGAALGFSLLYAIWAGFGVPVQRAWILLAMWVPMGWLNRRPPLAWGLVWAAWLILLIRPEALFDLGSQLSFAATAGLLIALHRDDRSGFSDSPHIWAWMLRATRVSLVAIAVTAPLLANAGLPIGVAGLLMNLVAVPFVTLVLLPVALLASGLALLTWEGAATGLVWAQTLAGWTVQGSMALAALLPVSSWVGSVSWLGLGVAAGLVGLIVREPSLVRSAVLLGSLLAWLLAPISWGLTSGAPRVVMFDVGQGDAVLLKGKEASVLIDGGRSFLHGGDMGQSVVVPGLRALGVQRLDVVVATHADLDHRGGLASVVSRFEVGEVWLPATQHGAEAFRGLRDLAESRGIPVVELAAQDSLRTVGDLTFEPLWPHAGAAGESTNEDSLVLRAEIANHSILLTGDIGASTEKALLKSGASLKADILKVAHHGSANSSTRPFLDAVGARIFLVSASCSGSSGLPSGETLGKLKDFSGVMGWTGRDGALMVDFVSKSGTQATMALRGWRSPRDCPVGEGRS